MTTASKYTLAFTEPTTLLEGGKFVMSGVFTPELDPEDTPTYQWYWDGMEIEPEQGFGTDTLTFDPLQKYNADTVTLTATFADDSSVSAEDYRIVVTPSEAGATVLKIEGAKDVKEGAIISLMATIAPTKETATYAWFKDGVSLENITPIFTKAEADAEDAGVYKVVVTFEDTSVMEKSITLTVAERKPWFNAVVTELKHRESGFIHIGWWELDLIDAYKKAGEDWRTHINSMYYHCTAKVIDAWLTANPDSEIEVQESRNGYILNREYFDYVV